MSIACSSRVGGDDAAAEAAVWHKLGRTGIVALTHTLTHSLTHTDTHTLSLIHCDFLILSYSLLLSLIFFMSVFLSRSLIFSAIVSVILSDILSLSFSPKGCVCADKPYGI